jgi:glycosyltransferase involved in cell wall biosynthesis
LMVSPFLPYPGVTHAGGKLVFFLLRTLSKHHSIVLLSRCFPGEQRHVSYLKTMLAGVEIIPVHGPVDADSISSVCRTVWSYYRLSRKASKMLKEQRFEICHVEFTETGVFWRRYQGIPSVLSCHDIIAKPAYRRYLVSRGFSRIHHWIFWKVKQCLEGHSVRKFQRVFTLSEEDLEWGKRLYSGVTFRTLCYPGGIDFAGLPRREVPGRILFLGAMHRPQNVESVRYFWETVWPSVRKEIQEAEFWVTGGGIPEALERELSRDGRVTMTGFVRQVEEMYMSASVFVAPILAGGGVIVKILDAMAAGVPVVTTTYGNEGIRAQPGKEILVADNPGDFVSSIVKMLRDENLRKSVGSAGKRYVDKHFSGDSLATTVEEVYRNISLTRPD